MKSNLIALFLFLFITNAYSQTFFTKTNSDDKISKAKPTYLQYDATIAFKINPNIGETNQFTKEKENWFIPDGLGAKVGYGVHYNKWVALGIHSGINWEWSNKLVVAPIYANFKLSPKISQETRIVLQTGLGKAIALGRGNLSGDYLKLSLGFQSDDLILFIEANQYDFRLNNQKNTGNIRLGVSLISF